MELAQAHALTLPLTGPERDQVERAAAAAGRSVDDFVRAAVLDAATDPFLAALEQAVDTVSARAAEDRVQHDYAT
ncbi:type II toxin -antitoxin system TacA 1-like antitoxin [Streptomyces hirsutus]|uniref:type II toxin -antitoxin system TacA 1-like antitoxin n=1 Tax=Streptomyces hirsutus TaxID=35620 RepID=UPI00331C739B